MSGEDFVLATCRRVGVVHDRGGVSVTALAEIELTIRERERIALYGESGSGKTTLLHVLGGLVAPSSGEIRWRGEPVATLDSATRRAGAHDGSAGTSHGGIALVFQAANLLPTLTAYENVAFAAVAGERDPAELLTLVGLQAKLDALPSELSGGEAQRVAIARALAQRPALLLCDEPTGHLDSDTGARMLDLIDALHAEYGFAQVTATHDADVAARYERAIGLADGRLSEEAPA